MKKLFLSIFTFFGMLSLNSQQTEFKSLYNNTFNVLDKIINSDIELDKINNANFLKTELNISEEEANSIMASIKNSGGSLMNSQNITTESCKNCNSMTEEKVIATFKHLRENKDEYEGFKSAWKNGNWDELAQNGGSGCANYFCFSACCVVCAYTIPVFPVYVCCAYMCYHECCGKIAPGGSSNPINSH